MKQKLIFIYNAKKGKLNALLDSGHKLMSPKTYSCNLCQLTHGAIGPKREWSEFIDRLKVDVVFLHKDQRIHDLKMEFKLPAIVIEKNGLIFPVLKAEELSAISTLEELLNVLKNKPTINELL